MENNNTQSKVEGEKPDKAHLLHFITGTDNPLQLTDREKVMIDKFLDYVAPLHSRIKELGELCESRRKDMELYTSEFFRVRDENFALKRKIKELEAERERDADRLKGYRD